MRQTCVVNRTGIDAGDRWKRPKCHVTWSAAVATRAAFFDDEFGHSFEEEWPEIARRLERFLAAKGVPAWLRADIVQETGTRLYRKWPKLDRSRPLWNLVVTIALGILVDERRKASPVEFVAEVPQPGVDDVETRAMHRVHLVKTRAALKQLRADQRRVLLAEIGEASALEGPRARINVLRLRARRALKSELGPWAPAGVALRVRSLRSAIDRRFGQWGHCAQSTTASMAGVAATATLLVSAGGLANTPPMLQESRPQDAVIASLTDLAEARSLKGVSSAISHVGSLKDEMRQRTEKDLSREDPENPDGFVEFQKQWLQDERQWAQERKEQAEKGQGQWAQDRIEQAEEDQGRWAQERKDQAEEDQGQWAQERIEQAEDQLP